MKKTFSFEGIASTTKGRSGMIVTTGIAVSLSPDGNMIVLQPVNSRGVISPASHIEVPVEKAEVIANALLDAARASMPETQPAVAAVSSEVVVESV